MIFKLLQYSLKNKTLILLFTLALVLFGIYSLSKISIGSLPDITNNQVQVITTSTSLGSEEMEKFVTAPIELEMANLPGLVDMRSVSKFGLSVVTLVFDEKMGTYLPRQLISEKLKLAEEVIPASFGRPFMGPITTGLGEIYQYVLEVDSAHKNNYSLIELRSIQDWIIKRLLSGIPGVVEVNTWGGKLKQYEIALQPNLLNSLGITIGDVYKAIDINHSISGGGFVEKNNQNIFIKGDGFIKSLEDIENILVKKNKETLVFIKDIATVKIGTATRYGAVTGNGKGEKILGQVMMLKGAKSKEVISRVKERVEEIKSSLPKGVSINPFLERSELISKTSFTIAENLILGFLIVMLVVILFLGNIRAGLMISSIIPLCMLFALSMMYIFDIDANLMSLGAMDFGIIIDGAIIIIEYLVYSLYYRRSELANDKNKSMKDSICLDATSKMMHSAIFGQIIILIVFIPILSLDSIEGKMFIPMGLVFCFAVLGAMLLCFTYVPVMCSLFLKPYDYEKTFSYKIIYIIQNKYTILINKILVHRNKTLFICSCLLIFSMYIFTRLGGEYTPTLDEGDFVIQPVIKSGTSLTKTIDYTTQIENILIKFPEVTQVVSRMGAAEIPTDPMSFEESDLTIKLEPKSTWVTAKTKDELADKFKEALMVIPGLEYEFTQPIEMRFNELITGVKTDVAVKIFGDNIDILYSKAQEIKKQIKHISGVSDISIEKIDALPQISIEFDRKKIANYGLDIDELEKIVSIGLGGKEVGNVYEEEKRFSIIVRFDTDYKQKLSFLENTPIVTSRGFTLPLKEFASISTKKSPAKISRDNGQRRAIIGINVRNRDMESVVLDIQKIIKNKIKMPAGYHIKYGGQFENLNNAKDRLIIVVPIALALIFIFLYFTFQSIKDALLIFSAIPLATIGGIILLYIKDIPFSISAGVGFIALFGIAVLNGIVLIEHYKNLSPHNSSLKEIVIQGTRDRLRPVLITAFAAAFGFLPMAISTSVGAEVQRPLAIVVIGGIFSSTMLTLFILPLLYYMVNIKSFNLRKMENNVN